MLDPKKRPLIFGHRGASKYAPENTLAAFNLAQHQGADGIELDVKLSADGHVFVIHDITVDRTTDGFGRVSQLTFEALRALDAGASFDPGFKGEKIPTLDEVFDLFGDKLFINVELKNYTTPFDSLPEKVAAIVARHNLANRILFSSFSISTLQRIKKLCPYIPVGLLTLKGFGGKIGHRIGTMLVKPFSLHPHQESLSQAFISSTHAAGRWVYPYTVNNRDDLIRLFAWGVDGVITDDPILAGSLRNR